MGEFIGTTTFDPTVFLGDLQRDLDAALADLAQVLTTPQQYTENLASLQFGITRLLLERPDELAVNAPGRAAKKCFLSAIGKFISFLDKLIGMQRLIATGITLDRPVTVEELPSYVDQLLNESIAKTAKDTKLTNPKKIACFPNIPENVRESALEYFGLRRTLEHHQDLPEQDLVVHIFRTAILIDGVEITALPITMEKGQQLAGRITREERQYPTNILITLTPQDTHDLIFSIRNVLAPAIVQAELDSRRPQAA